MKKVIVVFSIKKYLTTFVFPAIMITIITFIVILWVRKYFSLGFLRLLIVEVVSLILIAVQFVLFACSSKERGLMIKVLKNK